MKERDARDGVEDAEVVWALAQDVADNLTPPAIEGREALAALTRLQERASEAEHDAAMYHECRDQWKAQAESLVARAEAAEAKVMAARVAWDSYKVGVLQRDAKNMRRDADDLDRALSSLEQQEGS